ncbi:MAG: heavy-metal-associated domain-containing protein [Rubrobacteraceae bacterium]
MAYARFRVSGMMGIRCELTVERSLNGFPMVAANADFERGLVEVAYEEARVSPDLLEASIESVGYSAEPVWTSGPWEAQRGSAKYAGRCLPLVRTNGSCGCG